MEGTARIWFTSQQRAELWERWKNGQCVADIARALERKNKSGVYAHRDKPIEIRGQDEPFNVFPCAE